MSDVKKTRDISILKYFNILQVEYLLYELRTKIYPSKKDKENYFEVMDYKINKIENIANKNDLKTIFNSDEKFEEIKNMFLDESGVPKQMSNRDKYFYYFIGSDFVYKGKGVKLLQYNFDEGIATVEDENEEFEVDLKEIKRIL